MRTKRFGLYDALFLALLIAIGMQYGCTSDGKFQKPVVPKNQTESLEWVDSKLDLAINSIGIAYDNDLISRNQKNVAVDRWMLFRGVADAALESYKQGEAVDLESTVNQLGVFLRELVSVGVLKSGDEQ